MDSGDWGQALFEAYSAAVRGLPHWSARSAAYNDLDGRTTMASAVRDQVAGNQLRRFRVPHQWFRRGLVVGILSVAAAACLVAAHSFIERGRWRMVAVFFSFLFATAGGFWRSRGDLGLWTWDEEPVAALDLPQAPGQEDAPLALAMREPEVPAAENEALRALQAEIVELRFKH